MKLRRLVCRMRGHAALVRVPGHIGGRGAVAEVCGRCKVIVALRPAGRGERRRLRFER